LRAVNASREVTIARQVRLAKTLWARSRGLLGRKGLEPDEGLLIDPCSGIHTFGMAFPIDAAFLTREGTVVHLIHGMVPWRISRYLFRARSVLELPAGTLGRTGTEVGDRLVFED
jgi:uncharacterized membrane protein (UPF0127 family)